jgi:spore coat protein CotH
MGADLSPDEPEGLPWRIKLDEYVDGQSHDGETDFVVRGNSTETALNEAVSLELLDEAGLATQQASAVRFSVNGSEEQLRLVVQNPDDQNWYEENVDDNGVLFKAESGGDYSYRSDDYTAYTDAFDLEANPEDLGDEEAYQPLIAFLEFVNDADDETFAAELGDYLDIDSFADYLAIEELLGNTDDIDGPGNNSYLAYDPDTGLFTVIAWDHNLTLGSGMGGFGGAQGGGGRPGGTPPDGAARPDGGGLGSQSNALAERFQKNAEFSALVDEASARLTSELIDSGYAAEALEEWTTVLLDHASDLVPAEAIQSESDSVAQALSGA